MVHLARAGRFFSGCSSSVEAESKPRFPLAAVVVDLSMYLVCIILSGAGFRRLS